MKDRTFVELILENFDYPLRNGGFTVVHHFEQSGFYRQVVTFASGHCILVFVSDRGEVFMKVASSDKLQLSEHGLPDPYYDIDVVIPFLTREEHRPFYPPIDRSLPLPAAIDEQLAELARRISPYWEPVLALCASGELNRHRNELNQLKARYIEASVKTMLEERDKSSTDEKSG